tara:strand:- start:3577 stop:5508 length:1932 start_codon:yes stop_codon:yes gene_type:complete
MTNFVLISKSSKEDVQSYAPNSIKNKVSIGNTTFYHSDPYYSWKNSKNDQFYILGNIIGIRKNNKILNVSQDKTSLKILENFNLISDVEGRYVIIKISEAGLSEVWSDNFGTLEVYQQNSDDNVVLSSDLSLLPIAKSGGEFNQLGFAHTLTVYGSRPAKKHTLYKDVSRLGVNEGFKVINGNLEILKRDFIAKSTEPTYSEDKLEEYTDLFLEAVRARASDNGNIVYLSSGWDSTSILAALVHLFGKDKTRCIIGRMRYSERSAVINQIEIDKALAIADYYDVKIDIIELDYRKDADKIIERSSTLFRSHQFANMTSINHWRLAEETAKIAKGGETIFAGEMSDGAHNLGFSQYATIYHAPSQDFREYSDKMASYLFGPTFLKEIVRGAHENDPIWKIFMQINATTKFEPLKKSEKEIYLQFLSNFFLRGGRIPLYSVENSKMLTKKGAAKYLSEFEEVYLKDAAGNLTADTLYSNLLQLYNSFHWQGSTVSTLGYTAEEHGLNCVVPFHDKGIIDFLSGMPESWGRGLDFNNTKFPLKWMLKNKIDYPYHLQEGPHSYIYDVDPTFNHLREILFGSSFKEVFQKALKQGGFINSLSPEIFDLNYINGIVAKYLDGEEFHGSEMGDLGNLATHSVIGLYTKN